MDACTAMVIVCTGVNIQEDGIHASGSSVLDSREVPRVCSCRLRICQFVLVVVHHQALFNELLDMLFRTTTTGKANLNSNASPQAVFPGGHGTCDCRLSEAGWSNAGL